MGGMSCTATTWMLAAVHGGLFFFIRSLLVVELEADPISAEEDARGSEEFFPSSSLPSLSSSSLSAGLPTSFSSSNLVASLSKASSLNATCSNPFIRGDLLTVLSVKPDLIC